MQDGLIPPGPAESYSSADDMLRWMKLHFDRFGDIFKATVYGRPVYVISSPQYVEHVLLKNWQNYLRKGQAVKRIALSLGKGLIASNGDFWVSQRRMIQPAFRRDSVEALLGVFLKPNIALREKWKQAAQAGASVDVTSDISLTVLEVTLVSIFGDDYDAISSQFAIIADESRNMEFVQACSALAKTIVQIVAHRRSKQIDADDILGMMMRARDRDSGQAMPDAQLAREAMTLVIAGHETTASILAWTWYLLAKHPDIEAKMFAEIAALYTGEFPAFDTFGRFGYARRVIDEALRSYPPLWLMTRKAMVADKLGDYHVPAGTEIYISPYLVQRHPQLWEHPDGFDPDRFSAEDAQDRHSLAMCPFGAGPRNCIGEFFARTEMQVHILTIAKELQLRYLDPEPAEFVAGVNLLSRRHIVMKPEIRRA